MSEIKLGEIVTPRIIDKFKKLKQENAKLKKLCQSRNVGGMRDEIEKLRECVEFYADTENWDMEIITDDWEGVEENRSGQQIVSTFGGKRARKCLAKFGGK